MTTWVHLGDQWGDPIPFVANTTISILRGTYQNQYDDTQDSSRPIATHVPASLVEISRVIASPDSGRQFDVEYLDGMVRPRTDILEGDRVQDEANGNIYTVDSVSQSRFMMAADKRLRLRLLGS